MKGVAQSEALCKKGNYIEQNKPDVVPENWTGRNLRFFGYMRTKK